jgi:hypothetical protein
MDRLASMKETMNKHGIMGKLQDWLIEAILKRSNIISEWSVEEISNLLIKKYVN